MKKMWDRDSGLTCGGFVVIILLIIVVSLCLAALNTVHADPLETPALGLASGVECFNCAPFTVKVRLTNYDPMTGPINCWDYADNYCYSPTFYGIPWKAVWGFGAACDPSWPIGSWVSVAGVGNFICFDRGGAVTCKDGLCPVDILGPAGQWWNGSVFTATLWVPLNPPRKDR